MIHIISYLDDFLIIGRTKEEVIQARDSTLFFLMQLGFTINLEKSVLNPTQEIEFLGMMINSLSMGVWLLVEKVKKLLEICREYLSQGKLTLRELASLIGKLYSTQPAIAMAPLQVRVLQQKLIIAQQNQMNYGQVIQFNLESKKELKWWVSNLTLLKGNPVWPGNPDMIIYSDASSDQG